MLHELCWQIDYYLINADERMFSCDNFCCNKAYSEICNCVSLPLNIEYYFVVNFIVNCADEKYTFQVTFRQAENYPVDLYFLMDVSQTMRHFRETLKNMSYTLG